MFTLKISKDLGLTYTKDETSKDKETLKSKALELEKTADVRWVIVDKKDMPIYWCLIMEANLRTPKDVPLATDDPYMKKIAKKQGREVLNTMQLLKKLGITNVTEKELNKIKINAHNDTTRKAISNLSELIEEGVIEVLPNQMDKQLGKKLYGDDIDTRIDRVLAEIQNM